MSSDPSARDDGDPASGVGGDNHGHTVVPDEADDMEAEAPEAPSGSQEHPELEMGSQDPPEARDATGGQSREKPSPVPEPQEPEPDAPERIELEASPSTRCLNCGASLPGAFCPTCGQKDQPLRQPIHRYLLESIAEYLGIDGRIWPTITKLLFKPGRLTQAYVMGRRQEYIRPLRIYITSSLIFFFLIALINPVDRMRSAVTDRSDIPVDSTLTAGAYVSAIQTRMNEDLEDTRRQRQLVDSLALVSQQVTARLDSLEQEVEADSLQSLRDEVADAEEKLASERGDLREMTGSLRARRSNWLTDQLRSLPEDSLVAVADYETAAELLVRDGDTGPQFNGPDWLFRGRAIQELKSARTSRQKINAGWSLGRDVLDKLPTVIFLLLPFFALLLKLLFVRRGWYYAEHLVFALHVHAFAFVLFSVFAVLVWASGGAWWSRTIGITLMCVLPVYFMIAMRRVYAQGWVKTLFKTYLLSWMYGFILIGGAVLALALAAAT